MPALPPAEGQEPLFAWAEATEGHPAPAPPHPFRSSARARRMVRIRHVYAEPAAREAPRGRRILAALPGVPVTEVASHWRIPALHGEETNVARWTRVKTEVLVLGARQSLTVRPNGRSADWIAPGASNGCAMACAYCYVPRRKGYANPVTLFTNTDAIVGAVARHVRRLGPKREPNQCDPRAWVYDIGENGDCSVDALLSDSTAELVAAFRELPHAKASFATKFVNPDLLGYEPRGRTRIRFSLMPAADSRLLDLRTSTVAERIAAAGDFLDAGYEVHFNLSPVVLRPGWQRDWGELLTHLDDVLPRAVKEQAAAEVIMLTHNKALHEVNLGWHPRAEDILWQPEAQEAKRSQNGAENVRYAYGIKARALERLTGLIADHAPWLRVRYAF
ncbi:MULTISPECIES: spore photoproduct lyase family protein [unclassified Streptomyces]|uniref:spore photoproduct lyase family protein n=1 Tax=unclassified Streptomyces TaxID=2593676 RepID=UPI00081E3632|nr:spore photoproduct lyase family protein [Streptomyces sp. LcepLS]MYR30319.1 spore photoproduct lyase family protein [Streptomyces sp. SID4945]SCF49399.1 spore photoproduct lyase family protein [Streptomyces sp. LcepLS]